jgi:hypothetical protein
MGIYPIPIPKIPNFLSIYPIPIPNSYGYLPNTHTQILNIFGYFECGYWVYTQKNWVFGYEYWVDTHMSWVYPYHTQYPIPNKKVGTDVCSRFQKNNILTFAKLVLHRTKLKLFIKNELEIFVLL